ncbi:hypothetical protein [Sphingomonas flavescens]|uniref:hypothetical protein n=1 Tax=Sphingomonas flavescens TaxID=3132797 RepID=UPI002804271E|nr:hypothetical protein [Sphingomonas limnosediminicola]
MSESWHEERDRLVKLLRGMRSGRITHVDAEGLRELQATTPEAIERIETRVAELNRRLG